MEQKVSDKPTWRPTNPHDRFCRATVFHPKYAPDFLRSFGDPVLVKYVDLDHLQEAPTIQLSGELKEVIMDASLVTRLLDTKSMTEVLLHLEHKSRPSLTVLVQLLLEVALSMHFRWVVNNRTESGGFVPPIPLMVVVYNGSEDWDGEICFQDLFPDLPEELRSLVPQFRVIFINLRRFQYGKLPGKPETQAIAESLMRATDGTFIDHLSSVFKHVAESSLDEQGRFDLTKTISFYCTWAAKAQPEMINQAISNVFREQEYQKMIEEISNSLILEGIAIGEARGKVEGKIDAILQLLRIRFNRVPGYVAEGLTERTDLVALDSLFDLAAQCESIEVFVNALK